MIPKKIGTVVGVKSKGLLPWLIRLFTGKLYNHWFMVVKALRDSLDGRVKAGDICISEAIEEGIVYSPITDYDDTRKYTLLIRDPVNPIDENIINEEALKHFGNPYDIPDLVLEQPFFIITGLWAGDKSAEKWICVKWTLYLLWKGSGEKYFDKWFEDNNSFLCDTLLLRTIN
jgi:hypothetical protein